MKQDFQPSKDSQTIVIKLWETLKNLTENQGISQEKFDFLVGKVESLEKQLSRKDSEIIEWKEKLSTVERFNSAMEKNNRELNDLLRDSDAKSERIDELNKLYNSLLETNESLEQQNTALKEQTIQLASVAEKANLLELENASISDELNKSKLIVDDLEKTVRDFEFAKKDISKKNIDLNEKIIEIQKLKSDYANAQSLIFQFNAKQKELERQSERVSELEVNLEETEKRLRELSNRFENEKISIINSRASIEEELIESNHVINAHEKTIGELMGQLLILQNVNNDNTKIIKDLNIRIDELAALLEQKTNYIIELESGIAEKKSELSDLKISLSDYDEIKSGIDKKEQIIIELNDEISKLKENINHKAQQIGELNNSFIIHDSKVIKLNDELGEIKKQNNELEEKINYYINKSDTIEVEKAELSNKVSIMEQKLSIYQSENIELGEEVEKYMILKNKFEILEDEFNNKQLLIDTLNEQKREITNNFAELSNKYSLLDSKQSEINNEYERMKTLYSQTYEHNISLADKLEDYEDLRKQLTILADELAVSKSDISTKNEELQLLQDRLNKSKSNTDSLALFDNNDKNIIEPLQRTIENLERIASEKDRLVDKLKEELSSHAKSDETAKNYQHEKSILEESLEEARRKLISLDTLLNEKNRELEDNRLTIESLKTSANVEDISTITATYEAKIAELNRNIDVLITHNNSLDESAKIKSLENTINDLTSEKSLKDEKIIKLQEQISGFELRMNDIKKTDEYFDTTKGLDKQSLINKIENIINKLEKNELIVN